MPFLRDIQVALQSQYDAFVLPESPPTIDDSAHKATSYVPIFPGSQFWILYRCPRPAETPETRFYYFKLFINGRAILSWGVGDEEEWSGRVSFGLFATEEDDEFRGGIEKHSFFFPGRKDVDREGMSSDEGFEIKVFRAKARRRVDARYETCTASSAGIRMRPSGVVKKGDPKRFYKYALIDPADDPYATFCYHFRTSGQLKQMETKESPAKPAELAKPESKEGTLMDIVTESPTKDISPLSKYILSPPPKNKPLPPPKEFAAKDSIALRRLSLLQGSPVKKSRRVAEMFDAMEGLSLACSSNCGSGEIWKPSTSPKKLQKKAPSARGTTGLFSFGGRISKRNRGNRDDEQPEAETATPFYHAK